jgi:tetratricopeptide (TPR) repeat protein
MPQVGDAADTLGWIHFKRGSFRAALPFIQEALALNEKNDVKQSNPIIFYHLAEVQLALGDLKAAKAAAEKALTDVGEKHPTYARLQEILQQAG